MTSPVMQRVPRAPNEPEGKTMQFRLSSLRVQFMLLITVTCGLFISAITVSLWQLQSSEQRLLHFIDQELALERQVTKAYAQGLQMGQALRNILIDPDNPRAWTNFDKAQVEFNALAQSVEDGAALLDGGAAVAAEIKDINARWAPMRAEILERVKRGDTEGGFDVLVKQETPAWREMKAILLAQIDYLENTSARVNQEAVEGLSGAYRTAFICILLAIAACIAVSLFMLRALLRQLGGEPTYALAVAQRIAHGELDEEVSTREGDSESMLAAMREAQQSLRGIIGQMRHMSSEHDKGD
ncbi:methyl-accepting chemotaxis protein, partial [Wenzhouxiangella sp. XN24]|nr:methyl-accepting chemotaxis protein [Wenzhouxiangella sp. XN24]